MGLPLATVALHVDVTRHARIATGERSVVTNVACCAGEAAADDNAIAPHPVPPPFSSASAATNLRIMREDKCQNPPPSLLPYHATRLGHGIAVVALSVLLH